MDFADLHQYGQIRRAHQSVRNVAQELEYQRESARSDIEALHERIDRLTLVCEGLWDLLAESEGLSEEDLITVVARLDEADGTSDGRRTPSPTACDCGAMVNARVQACQFCGAPAPVRSLFDAI